MARDEAVLNAEAIDALHLSKMAGRGLSTIEHWTCPPGAAACGYAMSPPVNARRNAALKQQLAGKREILLLTRQQFVEAYQQSRSRERGHKVSL